MNHYRTAELFAGCGGLAIGVEQAGFETVFLNEFDKTACQTIRLNRPQWNLIEGDVREIDFKTAIPQGIELLTGGFPCQSFSEIGKKLGFEDTRGTLFFDFARAVRDVQPMFFIAENVRGLLGNNNGKTFETICSVLSDLNFHLIPPSILNANDYGVPQVRHRLFFVGIRNDVKEKMDKLGLQYRYPEPQEYKPVLRDVLFKGRYYPTDVHEHEHIGMSYSEAKRKVYEQVPEGGNWHNLPYEVKLEFVGRRVCKDGKTYWAYGDGGSTGMARRLHMDEPSITLLTSPSQRLTERIHPKETRPLNLEEYKRIQMFPPDWQFTGSRTAVYKQIGNAVPPPLARAMAESIKVLLDELN